MFAIYTSLYRMIRGCLFIGSLVLSGMSTQATEYSLAVYLIEADKVAAAIGSNDKAILAAMLADRDYVDNTSLEQRFNDPQLWRRAVNDLLTGSARENDMINGFALELLFRQLTTPDERGFMGLPFVSLYELSSFFAETDENILTELFVRIDQGNTAGQRASTLPPVLTDKLGDTEYPALVSVIKHSEIARLISVLPRLDPYIVGANDVMSGDRNSRKARRFLTIVEAAAITNWTEFASNPNNLEEGEDAQEMISRGVKYTLEDPYHIYEALTALSDYNYLDTLRNCLKRAEKEGKDIFLVYAS